jgi:hypothetical protein
MNSWICRMVLGALCLTTPASASTVLKRAVDELARSASVIARAKVVRTESRWSGDGLRILTDVELVVSETLKGGSRNSVLVTQPGGRVGDIAQSVSGLASFSPGEEVLVFLGEAGGGRYLVEGAVQGKYRLGESAAGALIAHPESAQDVLFLDPQTHRPVPPDGRAVSWTDLKSRIRRALQKLSTQSKP